MTALPVQYQPGLPAFLQRQDLFEQSQDAISGIRRGMPPHVSLRGKQWCLIDASGNEAFVNQLTLDVVVIKANKHASRIYYAGSYNPDGEPPDCYSDNGVGPSSMSSSPQAPACNVCPHAAYGSKINEFGNKAFACRSWKKLAIILAADTPVLINNAPSVLSAGQQVFLLKVPAMSMQSFAEQAAKVLAVAPLIGVIFRLNFDSSATYPLLVFTPLSYVTEALFKQADKLAALPATIETIGMDDVPTTTATATATATTTAPAQLDLPLPPPYVQPAVPVQQPPAPAAPEPAQARQRGRPRATAPAPVASPVDTMPFLQPAQSAPVQQTNGGVIQRATPTNPGMDDLLRQALAQ